MQRVCVFCGSSPGNGTNYLEAARELGSLLARRQLTLVYGGGNVGLMGQAARSCLEGGGDVIGVITRQLVKMEVALTSLENLEVVETMHERKARMAELADGFIAMPGGLGTIEEIFEVIT
ncbi:MAG: TIGR00730 family Rossman fold protein, partial [Chloroflexi bacterium]|nr:TIGR00730 family Rossman fold protein [Chloroflexota bacterium]